MTKESIAIYRQSGGAAALRRGEVMTGPQISEGEAQFSTVEPQKTTVNLDPPLVVSGFVRWLHVNPRSVTLCLQIPRTDIAPWLQAPAPTRGRQPVPGGPFGLTLGGGLLTTWESARIEHPYQLRMVFVTPAPYRRAAILVAHVGRTEEISIRRHPAQLALRVTVVRP